MPLTAVDNRRLYRQIADQIAALIEKGEYGTGQRLPAERDLARQLGVSRPSVREALIALEVEGYVEVRVGSGVYVVGKGAGGAEPLAARQATKPQIRAMEEALDQMESDRERGVMPLAADRLFHLRIAEASGNSALALVVKTLWDQRTGPLFLRLEHHFDTPHLCGLALKEHRDIVAAIARHDAGGARAAMRLHMNHAAKRFSKSWENKRGQVTFSADGRGSAKRKK